MRTNILFISLFLTQIFTLSFYLPRKVRNRINYVLKNYPPAQFPNLYTQSIEVYQMKVKMFWAFNLLILAAGMMIVVGLIVYSPDLSAANTERWDQALVAVWFFVQVFPMILMEIGAFSHFKRMREANSQTTRKALLQPRRLFDFISPALIGAAVIIYALFVALVIYMRQFDYPWFGGYANIAGVTIVNLLFAGMLFWKMYGKKQDPYQADGTRKEEIRLVAKQMVFTSIAVTIHIAMSILLAAFELRHLQSVAQIVYFQLIAIVGFQMLRVDQIDFEVYKSEPAPVSS